MLRILLVILVFISTGCHKKSAFLQQNQQMLNICFQTEVISLDPRLGIDYPSVFAIKMLFEGLMCIGLDGKVKPAIAEHYHISKDQKTYTFFLRSCKWSNGEMISAYDFEYSWKKVIDPQLKATGIHNFYPIKNVQKIVQGKEPIENVGFRAIDDRTLIVNLEHPTPYFLELLAMATFFPINRKVDQNNSNWANEEGKHFVCNGPFTLKKHRFNNEIIVQKNPLYWDADHVHLSGIKIAFIEDTTTQFSLFEKGELDWVGKPFSKLPLDAISTLKKENKIYYFPCLGLYWLFVNTESFPFNNKNMRKALACAINRKTITDHILQEEETPALSILPSILAQQKEPYFPDNDQKVALQYFQEALKELGITSKDLPEITFNYPSSPVHQRVAEAVQQQWHQILGIKVKLENQEWKVHYNKLLKGDFQIGGINWISWFRDPIYILQTFRYRSDGINMSRWENANYQKLLDQSEEEIDPNKRKALFHQAETLVMDELPIIPLYFNSVSYAKKPNLKDVYVSELSEVDFRWAYFDDESIAQAN